MLYLLLVALYRVDLVVRKQCRLLLQNNRYLKARSFTPLQKPFHDVAIHLSPNFKDFADNRREVLEFMAEEYQAAVDR